MRMKDEKLPIDRLGRIGSVAAARNQLLSFFCIIQVFTSRPHLQLAMQCLSNTYIHFYSSGQTHQTNQCAKNYTNSEKTIQLSELQCQEKNHYVEYLNLRYTTIALFTTAQLICIDVIKSNKLLSLM